MSILRSVASAAPIDSSVAAFRTALWAVWVHQRCTGLPVREYREPFFVCAAGLERNLRGTPP